MYKGKTVNVVVPAFNEEAFIELVINNVPDFVDKIYVVNDASTDHTYQVASNTVKHNGKLKIITHEENKGVGAAIVTGYKKVLEDNSDIAVVLAGDNQMDPKYLPELLNLIIEGKADYAKGDRLSRFKYRKGMSNWRFFGNWVLTLLTQIASGYWSIRDPQNGYTAISKEALRRINLDDVYPWYGYCNDILVKLSVAGARISEIPIPARYQGEKSKIRYIRYIPRVSVLLLSDFLWRLRVRYLAHMWRR